MRAQEAADERGVADISSHECAALGADSLEIHEVSGVCEGVKHHHVRVRVLREKCADKVGADEAGAACDEHGRGGKCHREEVSVNAVASA